MASALYEPEWLRLPSEMILSEAIKTMAEERRHWACVYDNFSNSVYFIDVLDMTRLILEHPEYQSLSLQAAMEQAVLRLYLYPVAIDEKELILNKLKEARAETEAALASLLPDRSIEARLKELVEYAGTVDPETGKVVITRRIDQGVYQHVLNILRLLADAMRQGLTDLPGIDRETLVQAAIFHDIGKVQPELQVGDVVDLGEAFEDEKLHAARGSEIVRGFYKVSESVIQVIRYHHHQESELPTAFPPHLLPMYRLFRLLDSLSLEMTRYSLQVKLNVKETKVIAQEYALVPEYIR
ncbi:MAG: HD domain-containing protein, partial [Fervidicoccus fontis]